MASKVLVSGKHALTVRISQETYKKLARMGADLNMTVNEMLAREAEKLAEKHKK